LFFFLFYCKLCSVFPPSLFPDRFFIDCRWMQRWLSFQSDLPVSARAKKVKRVFKIRQQISTFHFPWVKNIFEICNQRLCLSNLVDNVKPVNFNRIELRRTTKLHDNCTKVFFFLTELRQNFQNCVKIFRLASKITELRQKLQNCVKNYRIASKITQSVGGP
jgi:hypothetical protein